MGAEHSSTVAPHVSRLIISGYDGEIDAACWPRLKSGVMVVIDDNSPTEQHVVMRMLTASTWLTTPNRVDDGEPCPFCGEVPLELIDGVAECPNCGGQFSDD